MLRADLRLDDIFEDASTACNTPPTRLFPSLSELEREPTIARMGCLGAIGMRDALSGQKRANHVAVVRKRTERAGLNVGKNL